MDQKPSKRGLLMLSAEEHRQLKALTHSRTEPVAQVERARMLLAYADTPSIPAVVKQFHSTYPRVGRCIDKALQLGAVASLKDLPGRGRDAVISTDARAWVVSLACQKPKDLGYAHELWTTRLLAEHVHHHCRKAGHPALKKLGRGTVSKILSQQKVKPHKISYYLERRDPAFDAKMAQVLYVYKEVELLQERGQDPSSLIAILSYDEKPGIQAIENTAPDLPPVPGTHPTIARDHEYIRHGTMTLMAGIDLLNGKIIGNVVDRHRSREFIAFLTQVDHHYPPHAKIRIVMDNHSAHISKETRAYLAKNPNRFEFVFTPKHGSWLNLIESFFGKMAKTVLREIRVKSKAELKERILQYLNQINKTPVVFRWKYGLDALAV